MTRKFIRWLGGRLIMNSSRPAMWLYNSLTWLAKEWLVRGDSCVVVLWERRNGAIFQCVDGGSIGASFPAPVHERGVDLSWVEDEVLEVEA